MLDSLELSEVKVLSESGNWVPVMPFLCNFDNFLCFTCFTWCCLLYFFCLFDFFGSAFFSASSPHCTVMLCEVLQLSVQIAIDFVFKMSTCTVRMGALCFQSYVKCQTDCTANGVHHFSWSCCCTSALAIMVLLKYNFTVVNVLKWLLGSASAGQLKIGRTLHVQFHTICAHSSTRFLLLSGVEPDVVFCC